MSKEANRSVLNPCLPSPLVELDDRHFSGRGLKVYLKRDDLIHTEITGNKWRKLKYNIIAARDQGCTALLTFGGAYSNHIRAVAAAGKYLGFSTIGIIRGEEQLPLNGSLEYALRCGMRLAYLDRSAYRRKMDAEILEHLREQFGEFYILPEGGSNALAARGCAELGVELQLPFDVITCPVGTGGTLAGIAGGLAIGRRAIGFAVLKGGQFLNREVNALQQESFGKVSENWHLEFDYHFGGFARRGKDLDNFIATFSKRHNIVLDWVYVAKMMYGLYDMAAMGRFERGVRIVAVITG
jgi:1-aminocyclopropane-1-carboxylate deaminase